MSGFREAAVALFRFSGMPSLIRGLLVRNRVTIIVYHDPAPEVVERHLRYLSQHYRFIPLDLLVDVIRRKDWTSIPRRALVVTIDDGHKGNAKIGDVFARYGVRPMIYLCSQIVGRERQFWFRVRGVHSLELKHRSHQERLAELKQTYGWEPTDECRMDERQTLSVDELRKLQAGADFGSHTRFHPILTTCTDEECKEEIARSKQELETMLGIECKHFSYPNGDYSEREATLVRQAGYESARTIDLGWNGPATDPFKLKTTGISDDASLNVLACQVVGLPSYFGRLLKGSFCGLHLTTQVAHKEKRLES